MKPALAAFAVLSLGLVRCAVDAPSTDTAAGGGAGAANEDAEAGAGGRADPDAGGGSVPAGSAGASDAGAEPSECDGGTPPAGDRLYCNDGTASPCCTCSGSHRGCCSWHDGVAGCEPP